MPSGRIPQIADLAAELLATREQVRSGLVMLAAARHLALSSDGEITMAHPFTAVPLGLAIISEHEPARITTVGGECSVSLAPFS
jgi:hypothetical protein